MIFRDNVKYETRQWSNILKRRHPVFVLFNGPFLTEHDLSLLENYFTIGINRIFLVFDPTILLWQDKNLYREDGWSQIFHCSAIKYCRKQINFLQCFQSFNLKGNPYSFHLNPEILSGYGCSGALGCQLAYAMGASSIILLGMDCSYSNENKTDFYGNNKDHKPNTLKNFVKAMKWVQSCCKIPVYNCSNIPFLDSMSLEEAIERSKPISFSKLEWHCLFSEPNNIMKNKV